MSKIMKALDKAKQARIEGNPAFFQMRPEKTEKDSAGGATEPKVGDVMSARTQGEKGMTKRPEILVAYSQTRIEPVAHQVLRKNKLVAFFQGNNAAEQMKILRTQVIRKLDEVGGNTLMVTSANPREGKTFSSMNLGISISQELNKTALIVDADLREYDKKQHLNLARDFLGLDHSRGLSDYLLKTCEIADLLMNPGIAKLTLIPSGNSLASAAELLGSARMEVLMNELKNRYQDRVIIIDCPPVLTCPDSILLSGFADGILLIIEAEKTDICDFQKTVTLLGDRPIFGAILNKIPSHRAVNGERWKKT